MPRPHAPRGMNAKRRLLQAAFFLSVAGAARHRTGPWGPPCCEPQFRTGDAPAGRAVGRLGSGRALGHVSVASGIAGDALRDGLFVFRGKTQAGLKGRCGCPGGKSGLGVSPSLGSSALAGIIPIRKMLRSLARRRSARGGKLTGVLRTGVFSGASLRAGEITWDIAGESC